MQVKNSLFAIARVSLVVFLLLGTVLISAASAGPPAQGADPRPPNGGDGGDTGGGGNGGGSKGDTSPPEIRCASLTGQVLDWGVGGLGGVTTELKTGSWQLSATSATDGKYGYGGLGVGVAKLHVTLAPEQAQRLKPLIQDAGVYLNCDFPIVANIALYSGSSIDPPATINAESSSATIPPGQTTQVTLVVQNGLPTGISNVVVTALFAPGLMPINATSASTAPEAIQILSAQADGNLVAINLDKMDSGAKATIDLTVMAAAELAPGTTLPATATLFYRESAAHQDTLSFTIGRAGARPTATSLPAQPPVATETPVIEPTPTMTTTPVVIPAAVISATATAQTEAGEDFVPPGGLPTTGDNFVPPPDLLPITGQDSLAMPNRLPNSGISPISPLSGLGLAGLVFILHRVRLWSRLYF